MSLVLENSTNTLQSFILILVLFQPFYMIVLVFLTPVSLVLYF